MPVFIRNTAAAVADDTYFNNIYTVPAGKAFVLSWVFVWPNLWTAAVITLKVTIRVGLIESVVYFEQWSTSIYFKNWWFVANAWDVIDIKQSATGTAWASDITLCGEEIPV